MNKSTFSSSVILASLLVFTVFFVEAAPVPGSLEPPPIPPNGFIPAIFSKDLLFSLLCNIQLLHIRYIGLNEYRYNSATEKGAGHQYASFDRSIDGGNTSAPLVFLVLLQEFPEFLGTHDNLLIYIVKLHHTFCLLDGKMIAPVRADFITISRFIGIDHSMSEAEQNRAQSRRESRPESGRRRRRPDTAACA